MRFHIQIIKSCEDKEVFILISFIVRYWVIINDR
jgi:hypothetical protein